ncbi:cell division protein ZapB [Mesorhizobium sp. M0663]|uniref:cell division protein ZapB n=1 Tax=Mesorhizobium sp. M0663 TaxID=2956981 RepID=UPI0033390728
MAKKPMTREELLAQLDTLDNSTEIGKLKDEVSRLTEENASLISQRQELERQLKQEREALQLVREAIRKVDVRTRSHGADRPGHAEITAAADLAGRMELAEVQLGIQKGTHDPATGKPYTADTKPQRDLTAGAPKVTRTELDSFFPSLSGPEVDVTDTADALADTDLSELKTALEIAAG